MHRFYLDENLGEGILVIKDRAILHQLRNVLRIQKRGEVVFFNQKNEFKGLDFVYELKNMERTSANFLFKEKIENMREPNRKLVLYHSLIKKDRFEQVLQHCTEVGVFEFVPIISRRSEKKSLQPDRCEKILREAAEQSGRAIIPKFFKVLELSKAIELAKSSGFKTYFANTKEKENMIYGAGDRQVNLFIGPEGGWEDGE
jgi:16S rRNA (uracil1498-N3)-methyltransferase